LTPNTLCSPELRDIVLRGYSNEGDAQRALELVRAGGGVARAKLLAKEHGLRAVECAEQLEGSIARDALVRLAQIVVERDA
jgi:geranylgeranyl pyrophosphate synthase